MSSDDRYEKAAVGVMDIVQRSIARRTLLLSWQECAEEITQALREHFPESKPDGPTLAEVMEALAEQNERPVDGRPAALLLRPDSYQFEQYNGYFRYLAKPRTDMSGLIAELQQHTAPRPEPPEPSEPTPADIIAAAKTMHARIAGSPIVPMEEVATVLSDLIRVANTLADREQPEGKEE